MENQPLLTYCALPSRLRSLTNKTYNFVVERGHAPLHPFIAFPERDYADNGTFGRETAMQHALRLVLASEQLYLFGISDGTFREARRAYDQDKNIEIFIQEFDSDWTKYYTELRDKYGDFLDPLMEKKGLLVQIKK